jgi:hypothetical protein
MRRLTCAVKAEASKNGVVLEEFDAALELKRCVAMDVGVTGGGVYQPSGEALAAMGFGNGEFADVIGMGPRGSEKAGHRTGAVAQNKEVFGADFGGDVGLRHAGQRGRRVDSIGHIGKGLLQKAV